MLIAPRARRSRLIIVLDVIRDPGAANTTIRKNCQSLEGMYDYMKVTDSSVSGIKDLIACH